MAGETMTRGAEVPERENHVDESAMNEVSWEQVAQDIQERHYDGERTEEEWRLVYPQQQGESDAAYAARIDGMVKSESVIANEAAPTATMRYEEMVRKRVENGDMKAEEGSQLISSARAFDEKRRTNAAAERERAAAEQEEAKREEEAIAAEFDYQMWLDQQDRNDQIRDLRKQRDAIEDEFMQRRITQEEYDQRMQEIGGQIDTLTRETEKNNFTYEDMFKTQEYERQQEAEEAELVRRVHEQDPEALAFLEKHPEIRDEIAAAAARLNETQDATPNPTPDVTPEDEPHDDEPHDDEPHDDEPQEDEPHDDEPQDQPEPATTVIPLRRTADAPNPTSENNGGNNGGNEDPSVAPTVVPTGGSAQPQPGEGGGIPSGEDPENVPESEPENEETLPDPEREQAAKGLKGFFQRLRRGKEGANKRAHSKLATWQRVVLIGLAGVAGLGGVASFMNLARSENLKKAANSATDFRDDVSQVATETGEQATAGAATETDNDTVEEDEGSGETETWLVDGTSYGEHVQFNIDMEDYDGESIFYDYGQKMGRYNLTSPLYDMATAHEKTDVEISLEAIERLAENLDDPSVQSQFAALGGADVQIGDRVEGITSFEDMNDVFLMSQSDDEFRQMLGTYSQDMLRDLIEHNDVQHFTLEKGSVYGSLYAMVSEGEGKDANVKYFRDDSVTASADSEVLQFINEDGENVFDTNEIGGYKYNFLRAVGLIPENATDEEATAVMERTTVLGMRLACGQIIWQERTPDTGSEGTGSETTGTEDTGIEDTGVEDTGVEDTGEESTGTEDTGEESTGTEDTGVEDTGVEDTGVEDTGVEDTGVEDTGVEDTGEESTGLENTGVESTGQESEVTPKTDTIDDPNNPVLPTTEVTENTGVVERTEENDATNHQPGDQVTTQTEGEKERGDTPGADAITVNQGVTNPDGTALTDPTTGGQVVVENPTGNGNTATEEQKNDAQNGVASNYTPDNQQETGQQYEGEATEATNAQHVDQTTTQEQGNPDSAGPNTDYSDADLANLFNGLQ